MKSRRWSRPLEALALTALLWTAPAIATPEADLAEIRAAYTERFPALPADDYVLGVYAIDPALRSQWEEVNEFPPYEFALDEGAALFKTPLPDGRTLADCLPEGGVGTAHRWPRINDETGEVETLAEAINACRTASGAAPWAYDTGPLVAVLTWLAYTSRGERLQLPLPATPAAAAAFERGREQFYRKRGQRNLACHDCHVRAVGQHLREQTLAPLLGAYNHYPLYSLRFGMMSMLQARFAACFEQVGAAELPQQSREYRDLEYFLAMLGRGLPWVAPGVQR